MIRECDALGLTREMVVGGFGRENQISRYLYSPNELQLSIEPGYDVTYLSVTKILI
jgi:hypothetical protein